MKKETLEQLMELVCEEHERIKDEEFNGNSFGQAKTWEKGKTLRLLELQDIMSELSDAIQECK